MSELSENQRAEFAACGREVAIDPTVRIIGAPRISLGSNVRIDAYVVLSAGEGGIVIGDHVHIAAHCFLAGAAQIRIEDFANVSGRVSIYSSNDDYSGRSLMGPTVPDDLRSVTSAPVVLESHAIIGAGSVVLPGVTLAEGAGVGAMSLVREDVDAFAMVAGAPASRIGSRSSEVVELGRRVRDAR